MGCKNNKLGSHSAIVANTFGVCALEFEGQPAGATQRSARLVITPTPTLTKTRVNHFEHFKENDSIQLTKQRGE